MADDPFAQFGGASVDTSSGSDPFAAFGGQSIDTSPDASVPFQNPPGSHRYSVLPWMEDAQGRGSLAMPEMLASPIRGMVKGGQAAWDERNAMSLSGDPDLLAAASLGGKEGPNAEGLRYPGGAPPPPTGTLGQRIVAASRDKTDDPEVAASQVRVANGIDAIKKSDPTLDDLQAANNFKTTQQATINGTIRQLSDSGAFDDDPQLLTDLRTLTNRQALQRNNTIDMNDDGLLSRIDDLDAHPDVKSSLRNAVIDLNTAAPYSFRNQMSGPFEVIGNKVGQGVGLIGGAGALVSGHPIAGVGMMLGQKGEAAAGAKIGAGLDRLFGTQSSAAAADRVNALKMVGINPAAQTSSSQALRAAQSLIKARTTPAQQSAAADAARMATQNDIQQQILNARQAGGPPPAPGTTPPEAWQQPSLGPTHSGMPPPSQPLSIAQQILAQRQAGAPPPAVPGQAPQAWQQPSLPSPGMPPTQPMIPAPMVRTPAQPEAWQQPSVPSPGLPPAQPVTPAPPMQRAPIQEAWQHPSVPSPGLPPSPPATPAPPMQRTPMQEAWQQPSLPPNHGGQTELVDPDTGLPRDTIPVNTPIKAKVATPAPQRQASSFRPNTPQDVRAGVAESENGASAGTPSPQVPQGVPSTPTGLTGGAKWIANNVPGDVNYADIAPHAQAAEAAGEIPKGTADKIAQGLPIDSTPFNLKAVQSRMLKDRIAQQQSVGIPSVAAQGETAGSSPSGFEGIRNIPSYMKNLEEEKATYDNIPQPLKAAADLIRSGKSKEERLAIMQASGHTPEEQALLLPLTRYGK